MSDLLTPLRNFVVVYEAPADFNTATELADRVMLSKIDWLEPDWLPSQRSWVSTNQDGELLAWKSIPRLAHAAKIRASGHFGTQPAKPDARAARRAISYIHRCFDSVAALVLIRDLDDQPERREGLQQARDHARDKTHIAFPIVIGVARVERESWVLSGFLPLDDGERERLQGLRQELGFDPTARPHELTAGKDDLAKKSPKRVLKILVGSDANRERSCWHATPLDHLRSRGGDNGLAEFLDEVDDRLVPLIHR